MPTDTEEPKHSFTRRHVLRGCAWLGAGALTGCYTGWPGAAAAQGALAAAETPADALARLRQGNARFAAGAPISPQRDLARLREVIDKQTPFAAVLGCADSRVPVELAYDQGFGDLFVVRVAGNVASAVEIASLEFGARILGAKAIVVLGHSSCGAVKAALAGGKVPGQISTLYTHIAPALDRGMSVDEATIANVRYQARKLKSSPLIAQSIDRGELLVNGGVFDIATGRVQPVEL
ncbi:MAG: carbonic anhydrase [Candidatus Binatia bacterium]